MAATSEAPTKRTRKTTPSEYYLQQQRVIADSKPDWAQPIDEMFPDAEAAIKHVKDNQLVGKFRIIRVVRYFTVTKETKTVMKIT